MIIRFQVDGTPVQQGNHRRNAAGAVYETSKDHRPWRDSVVWHAREARPRAADDGLVFDGPVHVTLNFTYPRPKSHYRTGAKSAELRDDARTYKVTAPDVDKLTRSILDALAIAGIYRSDAQVAELVATKRYSDRPGVDVWVEELDD